MSTNFRVVLLVICVVVLAVLLIFIYSKFYPVPGQANPFSDAEEGRADLSQRASDFPATYISNINVDLTSPHHWVSLEWAGPNAADQKRGPFHSSPGRGTGWDCNQTAESRRNDSCCTPKGTRFVEGFNDFLPSVPNCKYVTWFDVKREIGIHSHEVVPDYPDSLGCVRVDEETAQLIHNNAINGKTRVHVDGQWSPPSDLKNIKRTR